MNIILTVSLKIEYLLYDCIRAMLENTDTARAARCDDSIFLFTKSKCLACKYLIYLDNCIAVGIHCNRHLMNAGRGE